MAVKLFYGMTKSGKTTLAEKLLGQIARAVIFDFTGKINPKGAYIVETFTTEVFLKIYDKFKDQKNYKIVLRPRGVSIEARFNMGARLALALGKYAIKIGLADNLVYLVDEGDFVCSATYQSEELKILINVGRHDNVDTWMIARMPQRLHTDARGNASGIFCFKLTDDSALRYVKNAVGKIAAEKIKKLEQYSFLAWKDTGETFIYDKNQKQLESWS